MKSFSAPSWALPEENIMQFLIYEGYIYISDNDHSLRPSDAYMRQ